MKKGISIIIVAFSAASLAPVSAQVPLRSANTVASSLGPEPRASDRSRVAAPVFIGDIAHADSSSGSHWRATLAGGLVGGVVGGLAAAAYVLNATAYRCTTVGPSCPNDNRTTRRVITITVGSLGGAALGAFIGHALVGRR
jgi:hypothetical protein